VTKHKGTILADPCFPSDSPDCSTLNRIRDRKAFLASLTKNAFGFKGLRFTSARISTSRALGGIAKSPVQTKPQSEREISYPIGNPEPDVTAITDFLPGHFDHSKRATA
jgi:hypothetical protein